MNCEFTDRIQVAIASESDVLTKTLEEHGSSIAIELLLNSAAW